MEEEECIMKVAGSLKCKNASKANGRTIAEKKTESKNMVLGQIKLEDLEQERLEVRKSVEKKTSSKKPVEKKLVNAAAVETKAEETVVEAAETVAEVKTEETAAVETKTEAAEVETPAEEAVEAKKETKSAGRPAKTAAKKETKETKETKTTKAAKTVTSEKVVLQIGGRADLSMDSLVERVKAAYVAEGHKADAIKNIEVYIKLEENMAYYVIDGYASGISLY